MLLRHIPRKGDLQTEVELVLSGATGYSGCDQLQFSFCLHSINLWLTQLPNSWMELGGRARYVPLLPPQWKHNVCMCICVNHMHMHTCTLYSILLTRAIAIGREVC